MNYGTLISTLDASNDTVEGLQLLKNGCLVSGNGDKTIKIWNVNGGNLITTLYGHKGSVCSLALLDNGFLASSGEIDDKTIKIQQIEH